MGESIWRKLGVIYVFQRIRILKPRHVWHCHFYALRLDALLSGNVEACLWPTNDSKYKYMTSAVWRYVGMLAWRNVRLAPSMA